MERVPLLSWTRQGVGVPCPDVSREFGPSPQLGQSQGPQTRSRSASARILGAQMLFSPSGCPMALTPLPARGLLGRIPPSHGKPSLGFRAVPPPNPPEATRSLQPQWWLFPHFNEEYISDVLIISHQTAPEAASAHTPVEMAPCSF